MAIGISQLAVMDAFVEDFGKHIRFVRLGRGLTQEELAHRAGVHVTYLSGIERGRRNPSLKNIRLLAMALEVTVSSLFEDIEDEDEN